ARDVDEIGGPREALLQCRDERMAAGEELALGGTFDRLDRLVDAFRAQVVECVHGYRSPYPAARPGAPLIARHTRSAVAGMSMRVMRSGASALCTAFMTAAGEPIAPTSPTPFTPRGLCVQSVLCVLTLKDGRSSALGMV